MLYFKHSELVDEYHVSLKTVHNWIDATKQGKLDLKLHDLNGRTYIVNSPDNVITIASLVEQGKKYRNVRYRKVVTPKPEFYELYSRKQILDIISNLSIHREMPRQYNYFGEGAQRWDSYIRRMLGQGSPNLLRSTIRLLDANLGAIDTLLEGKKYVNVIDVGPGNGMPVRKLLAHLLEQGTLHRYIAVDISESILEITRRNIQEWFGDKVVFEGHIRDIGYERFGDLLVDDMLSAKADETINLGLLLGATPINFRNPADVLKVVNESLGPDDLLIYTDIPDSEAQRKHFNITTGPDGTKALSPVHSYVLELMNIDESLYDVEVGFNEQVKARYIRIRLKTALTITFKFENGERSVDLEKGEAILMLRVWHMSPLKIISEFDNTGYALLQVATTLDHEYLLGIFGIETEPLFEL